MELWCIVLICSLALAALCLLAYLLVLRHSLREAAEELDEKLRTDTNTLISISSGDRAMQSLVTHINRAASGAPQGASAAAQRKCRAGRRLHEYFPRPAHAAHRALRLP